MTQQEDPTRRIAKDQIRAATADATQCMDRTDPDGFSRGASMARAEPGECQSYRRSAVFVRCATAIIYEDTDVASKLATRQGFGAIGFAQ